MQTLQDAYRECEQITWSQARNFAYGIRLLPPDKRRGLAAIYAYARRIDDIGDGTLSPDEKIALLERERTALASLASHSEGDPVRLALADVEHRFPQLNLDEFGELIDGCVADVRGVSYETFEDLHHYCRCVAGFIGRLSLGIFGYRSDEDLRIADALSVALQLTNILRDIREDKANGRVYLPAEDLKKFEISLDSPMPGPFLKLMDFEIERARDWYATGLRLLSRLDRRSAACTGAMAGIYRRLLERIADDPAAVLNTRVSLPASQKALVAVRALTNPGSIR